MTDDQLVSFESSLRTVAWPTRVMLKVNSKNLTRIVVLDQFWFARFPFSFFFFRMNILSVYTTNNDYAPWKRGDGNNWLAFRTKRADTLIGKCLRFRLSDRKSLFEHSKPNRTGHVQKQLWPASRARRFATLINRQFKVVFFIVTKQITMRIFHGTHYVLTRRD